MSGFDPQRNRWVKTLNRVRGQISRLLHEQHLLQTFAADESKSGSHKKIRQTHETRRALDSIKRSKQIIRECLHACEEAQGHPPIPAECFDDNGEIDFRHILCSACADPDADDDNDILLCDGEFCNRAYHVGCLPVRPDFDAEALPEDEGWLCPACDCRADILWCIAEAFDMDYNAMLKSRWQEVLVDEDIISDLAAATGPATILSADLPSDDEEDDEDFAASDSASDADDAAGAANGDRGEGTSAGGAGPSRASARHAGNSDVGDGDGGSKRTSNGHSRDSSSDDDDHNDQDDDDDDDDDDSDGDDDYYEDDSDAEGADGAALLAQLEEESKADPQALVLQGKRRRTQVDYRAMNAEMFGDLECYEGEGVDDVFVPDATYAHDDD